MTALTASLGGDHFVAGAAIGATGFIKIGGVTGGNFAAGALTGITATCSGSDVQGWTQNSPSSKHWLNKE